MRQVLCALCLLALGFPLAGASGGRKTWHGNWVAQSSHGNTMFGGTWDAMQSDKADTMTGNWTMTNRTGETVAKGTWTARKDRDEWAGSWQARDGALSGGAWRAQVSGSPAEAFEVMFDAALNSEVGGTWRMGTSYWGTWSIRAYPP